MIMLDTHIWYWYINRVKLSSQIIEMINEAEQVAISSISCFEMAWLVKHQRIHLSVSFEQWFEKATDLIKILPVTPIISTQSAKLPEHHRDPMDRFIISTALFHQATLISFDSAFPNYCKDGLKLIHRQSFNN
jgi:PIN domain nuclease of toxin-antitoxin system